MGVRDVWTVAAPCEERISLHALRGSTLAVDLAGWVVQNNTAPGLGSGAVTRPHLRNIFFRVQALVNIDILPIVVLDGAVPKEKAETVRARNALAWGARPTTESPKRQQRRQFSGVLRDCARLLASLGVPTITAPGEAEAFCAALNAAGLVDAVVSDDSDCFCYGAKTVLRNFSVSPGQFCAARYTAARLEAEVGLSRERMVVMAIVLGCDYSPGVAGLGREALVRLFASWGLPRSGELERVVGWREAGPAPHALSKPVHCGTCGHPGSLAQHRRGGCGQCGPGDCREGEDCNCTYHQPAAQAELAEWRVRSKAVTTPDWPFKTVVKEFYRRLEMPAMKFVLGRPKPGEFVQFCTNKMDWKSDYCVVKIIDVVVRWQVKFSLLVPPMAIPEEIVKKRIKAGEDMFEVQWSCEDPALPECFTACVPADEFTRSYEFVLQNFNDKLEAKAAAKKKPKRKPKALKEKTEKKGQSKHKNYESEKNQPTLVKFISSKSDDLGISNDKENVPLAKPKNVVFKRLRATDPRLDNIVLERQMRTPNSSNSSPIQCISHSPNMSLQRKTDSRRCQDSILVSDSMREYMDNSDSDLSEIIEEIVGKRRTVQNDDYVELLSNMSIQESPLKTPECDKLKRKFFQTSTPYATPSANSPLLKKVQINAMKSRVLNERKDEVLKSTQNIHHANNESVNSEESFDEFDCLDKPSLTPFAERVKKKMNA